MIKLIKHKMMYKSRLKKYEDFLTYLKIDENSTILDVGVADKEYSPYDNFLEKRYPHKSMITALSVQELNEFTQRYPQIKTYIYGGDVFPFKERQFSAVHSNAVVEHVGSKDKQIKFIRELARCGENFFFSTPAKEFPVEIHTNMIFLHWLPKKIYDKLLRKIGKTWASGDYMNLLSNRSLKLLMGAAKVTDYEIITYKLFGFPYQYVVYGRS